MRPIGKLRFLRASVRFGVVCLFTGIRACPQQAPVTLQVEVVPHNAAKATSSAAVPDRSNIAVWLTPIGEAHAQGVALDPRAPANQSPPSRQNLQVVQRNKAFEPHFLIVQVGSTVQFPNKDPFFHNVFSLFDGKRFDLGLYEGGSSNSIRFDRPGISFLFCNIHPEMSGVIVVVDTPYYALSDRGGRVAIPNVPDGRYQLHAWYERSSAEDFRHLGPVVTVSDSTRSLETLQVIDTGDVALGHKNKYGHDYLPVTIPSYKRP